MQHISPLVYQIQQAADHKRNFECIDNDMPRHGDLEKTGHAVFLCTRFNVPYLCMKRRSIQFFQTHTQWPWALNAPQDAMACFGPVASKYKDFLRGR